MGFENSSTCEILECLFQTYFVFFVTAASGELGFVSLWVRKSKIIQVEIRMAQNV